MFETVMEYIIVLCPGIIAFGGIVFSMLMFAKKATSWIAELVNGAKQIFKDIKEGDDIKEIRMISKAIISQNKLILEENKNLKRCLIEATEAITRIRNKHPELFAEDNDGKN